MSVEVDASELREFAADVRHLPAELSRHLVPTVKRGAVGWLHSPRCHIPRLHGHK